MDARTHVEPGWRFGDSKAADCGRVAGSFLLVVNCLPDNNFIGIASRALEKKLKKKRPCFCVPPHGNAPNKARFARFLKQNGIMT
jgi:hypothetical protein